MATWVVHCVATCEDCGREFQNYKNAQALAARHAYLYGHRVTGEVGLAFEYKGKGVCDDQKDRT